ncbi:hypothetical protein GBA52_029133 [Prunus armeniaca]|nr:hypothetical protein GBA52_029133 [Prunus armeniaca]
MALEGWEARRGTSDEELSLGLHFVDLGPIFDIVELVVDMVVTQRLIAGAPNLLLGRYCFPRPHPSLRGFSLQETFSDQTSNYGPYVGNPQPTHLSVLIIKPVLRCFHQSPGHQLLIPCNVSLLKDLYISRIMDPGFVGPGLWRMWTVQLNSP